MLAMVSACSASAVATNPAVPFGAALRHQSAQPGPAHLDAGGPVLVGVDDAPLGAGGVGLLLAHLGELLLRFAVGGVAGLVAVGGRVGAHEPHCRVATPDQGLLCRGLIVQVVQVVLLVQVVVVARPRVLVLVEVLVLVGWEAGGGVEVATGGVDDAGVAGAGAVRVLGQAVVAVDPAQVVQAGAVLNEGQAGVAQRLGELLDPVGFVAVVTGTGRDVVELAGIGRGDEALDGLSVALELRDGRGLVQGEEVEAVEGLPGDLTAGGDQGGVHVGARRPQPLGDLRGADAEQGQLLDGREPVCFGEALAALVLGPLLDDPLGVPSGVRGGQDVDRDGRHLGLHCGEGPPLAVPDAQALITRRCRCLLRGETFVLVAKDVVVAERATPSRVAGYFGLASLAWLLGGTAGNYIGAALLGTNTVDAGWIALAAFGATLALVITRLIPAAGPGSTAS